MTKHELGQKHFCTNCGAKFYDMTKSPPTCPKCETVAEPVVRPRPTRSSAKSKAKAVKPKPVVEDETKVLVEADGDADASDDDEAGDDVIEDVSELGEDEADLAGVVSGDDETT